MSRGYIFITQIMPCLICGNHHQTGSMNYCPLFGVMSWNNGMRCMSFYILMEAFSTLLALCAGNSPVTDEFPSQRPVTRTFDVFFGLCLNKGWANNRDTGDLRRHRAHYDVTVVPWPYSVTRALRLFFTWTYKCTIAWCYLCFLDLVNTDINCPGSLSYNCSILIPAWISNYIHYNVCGEITYPLPNFNCATVAVCEWISKFISYFIRCMLIYPRWDQSYSMLIKGAPDVWPVFAWNCNYTMYIMFTINVWHISIYWGCKEKTESNSHDNVLKWLLITPSVKMSCHHSTEIISKKS